MFDTTTVPRASSCDNISLSERVDTYLYRPLQAKDADLVGLPQARCWVNWRFELRVKRNGEEKLTKVPYMPNGRLADTTNPATWSTFAEVTAVQDRFDGVGFVFTGTMLGIDLDKCVIDGKVSDETRAFLESVRSYTESSPSRKGLHAILGLTAPLKLVRNRHGNYEVYTEARFFTFTAEEWETSFPLRLVTPEEAEKCLRLIGYPWGDTEIEHAPDSASPKRLTLTDEEVLTRMFSSKHGEDIRALYNGDTSKYDNDESRADEGLCTHLAFWTAKNPEQMERLWLASSLGARAKTQKRREDYRNPTIKRAIEICKEVYEPPTNSDLPPFVLGASAQGAMASPAALKFIPDTELLEMGIPATEWLVEGLFARGTLNMHSSPPNTYKTFIELHVALSVAHGLRVFDEFETHRTNVLYIQEEDTLSMVKERYGMLLREGEQPGGVFFAVDTGRKISAAWAQEVVEMARERDAGLVILDSLRALHTAEENNADAMQPVMETLKIITRAGMTVIFTHHHRKGMQGFSKDQEDGGMDAARGSSAITAAVFGHITCVERKDDGHYLTVHQAKLKNGKKMSPFRVNIGETLEPPKISFTYGGPYDADTAAVDAMCSKLMSHFRQNPEALYTRKQLAELGFAKSSEDRTLRDALAALATEIKVLKLAFKDLPHHAKATFEGRKPNANAAVYRFASHGGSASEES